MLISILTTSFVVESIALNAGLALSLLDVVVETVRIFINAKAVLVKSKSLLTTNACSVSIGITVGDLASFVGS